MAGEAYGLLLEKEPSLGRVQCNKETLASPLYTGVTPREREVLAAYQKVYGPKFSGEIGQSIDRPPYRPPEPHNIVQVGTLLPHGHMWIGLRTAKAPLVSEPRFLTCIEALLCQGFPAMQGILLAPGSSHSFLNDLAGNAYSGQVMTYLTMALFVGIPWRSAEERSMADDARAMFLLSLKPPSALDPSSDSEA